MCCSSTNHVYSHTASVLLYFSPSSSHRLLSFSPPLLLSSLLHFLQAHQARNLALLEEDDLRFEIDEAAMEALLGKNLFIHGLLVFIEAAMEALLSKRR
jgi:hypothetical protein